jgi:hypothetical protein
MADIASMTTAMKARAKAAIDALDGGADSYTSRTPRQLRALILTQSRTPATRTAMTSEGWFEATSSETWASASNQTVDVS